jgi:antitoxin component YwqK of YwqJK toxin-antitoxin module
MEGYKIGYTNNRKVIITLLIPDNAKTNKNRNSIINKKHAKYRCNRAYVIDIEDEYEKKYNYAVSFYFNKKLLYEIDKIVESDFDEDIEIESGEGIHYFIDKETALNYKIPILYQIWENEPMIYRDFYGNGHAHKEIKFYLDKENKYIIYKNIQEYYKNGLIKRCYNLAINKYDGQYTEWYESGIMKKCLKYDKNKVVSIIENWDVRGITK